MKKTGAGGDPQNYDKATGRYVSGMRSRKGKFVQRIMHLRQIAFTCILQGETMILRY